jgi:hypothetical protein
LWLLVVGLVVHILVVEVVLVGLRIIQQFQ